MKKLLLLIFLFGAYTSASAQLARGHHKFFGNILKTNDAYPEDFSKYWNQATPENAGKWDNVEDDIDVMEWEDLDSMISFAQDNAFPFKHHALIWGKNGKTPDGLEELSDEEQIAEIEEWMAAFCERYDGKVQMIDVVNEPLHETPFFKSALGGNNNLYGTGWDWVIKAFEMAREHCPNAELILNDYNLLNITRTTNKFIPIVEELKKRNLIDAIGCQAHTLKNVSYSKIKSNLDLLINTGVDVYISELDLNIANDNAQKNKYESIFPLFWENPKVKGVTLWGYKQGTTWRPYTHLLRDDGSERPALVWLKNYIANYDDPVFEGELFDDGADVIKYKTYVGDIEDDDWLRYSNINFGDGFTGIKFKYAKGDQTSASVEMRKGSVNGELVGAFTLQNTGNWNNFTESSSKILSSPTGIHDIYLVFKGSVNFDFFSLLNEYKDNYYSITSSPQDAEENAKGIMNLDSRDLDFGARPYNGMIFSNIGIPRGAIIKSAYLQFTADNNDQSSTSNLIIKGEDVDNALPFENTKGHLSSKKFTIASTNWDNVPAWNIAGMSGEDQKSPDISGIIQEIINKSTWSSGNAMALYITGTGGKRSATSFDGDPGKAPKLIVDFDLNNQLQVNQSTDDAEEINGMLNLNSSDLDFGTRDFNGIRFQNVSIEQGATIVSAFLQFVADENNQGGNANYTISGEASDNAATFSASENDLSIRTKTSVEIDWTNVPAWNTAGASGNDQRSPDIAAIVQEIVDRPGWNDGNSLVLFVHGISGKRSAKSYDSDLALAPKLIVEVSSDKKRIIEEEEFSIAQENSPPSKTRFYPNPAINNLEIRFEKEQNNRLIISNLSGKAVKKIDDIGLRATLDIKGLAPGFYILKLNEKSHKLLIK